LFAIRVVQEKVATKVKCEALVATLKPHGLWFGGLHEQIMSCSGNLFHARAIRAMPLKVGQVLVLEALVPHYGYNNGVIFVVEDGSSTVYDITTAALRAATDEGMQSICIPTFDAEVDDLCELAQAIADFKQSEKTIEVICAVSNFDAKCVLEDELWLV
jgi:hypothetical protein